MAMFKTRSKHDFDILGKVQNDRSKLN